ncbi:uncharacterized protein LOC116308553 [Actinia tenebrosa]|uniref:Uncharacterized protein LOC116308553 n=1 Tax=Actinia tenebrosa TaxID=6105 RepID=A0A6P8J5B8_ACTTE|nr:uncharacterized protein LOC116308553 [Actinia tenebrosa]
MNRKIILNLIAICVALVQFADSAYQVHKNTPIPVYTSKSPVIIPQTKLGFRSNLGRNVFFGYMLYRYGLMEAPVYRGRYPIHRSTVEIPDERAIRVNFTKEIMLDSNGTICLNSTKSYTIAPNKSVVLTSVRYSNIRGGLSTEYFGDNRTVTIDMNTLNQTVEITTRVLYRGTIVANTSCTQVMSVMNGTIVRMYATNPNADTSAAIASVQSSFLALILSSLIYCAL